MPFMGLHVGLPPILKAPIKVGRIPRPAGGVRGYNVRGLAFCIEAPKVYGYYAWVAFSVQLGSWSWLGWVSLKERP